jgi:hypothetical protein
MSKGIQKTPFPPPKRWIFKTKSRWYLQGTKLKWTDRTLETGIENNMAISIRRLATGGFPPQIQLKITARLPMRLQLSYPGDLVFNAFTGTKMGTLK